MAALLAGLAVAVPSSAQVGNGKIAFSNRVGIYSVNPDGTGLTQLRRGDNVGNPHWSPEGSQLAFTSFENDYKVYVVNADGSNVHVVASGDASAALGSQPWSPDGMEIAYRGGNDVYVVSSAGGPARRLTFNGDAGRPVWSPVGSELVYSRTLQNRSELFVIDAGGGTATQITQSGPDLTLNEDPAWSPDGQVVAFVRDVNGLRSLYTVHSDGTELHRVTGILGRGYDAPSWSPDGARIAFSTWLDSRYSQYAGPGRQIFTVNVDGSGERPLTEGATRSWTDSGPIWSPDGEQILFVRYSDRARPYTMNVDGSCEGALVPDQDEGWSGSWQPIPGGPSAGAKRCHAVSVEASIETSSGRITAVVGNEGTETLTDVVLFAQGASVVSLTSGQVESGRGTCRRRSGSYSCRIPRLDRGERVQVWIVAEARRVTYLNDPKPAEEVGLTTPISVSAAQGLLESGRESESLWYSLPTCSTRTAGGGTIKGTSYVDRICGRKGADRIFPRGGRDAVQAGAGPDYIFSANDGRRDNISCGGGRDRVIADRRDRVSGNCERVSRR